MANENKVIELLKNEAAMNPAFNAVCHVFAVRQRTRYKVTIQSLMATMKKEGFTFSKAQYMEVLKFLSTLGFGQLVLDGKKRVKALDGVKVTLQSIGKAALGQESKVKRKVQTHRFTSLISTDAPPMVDPKKDVTIKKGKPVTGIRQASYPTFLTVVIEGRLVSIPTKDLAPDDLGDFIVKFKKLGQEPSV